MTNNLPTNFETLLQELAKTFKEINANDNNAYVTRAEMEAKVDRVIESLNNFKELYERDHKEYREDRKAEREELKKDFSTLLEASMKAQFFKTLLVILTVLVLQKYPEILDFIFGLTK